MIDLLGYLLLGLFFACVARFVLWTISPTYL